MKFAIIHTNGKDKYGDNYPFVTREIEAANMELAIHQCRRYIGSEERILKAILLSKTAG